MISYPKTPLPTSSGSSLQQGNASTESSWSRFLINLVGTSFRILDADDQDGHLCRRSLIEPGRWRAPARSSWSPFFIHKSWQSSKCLKNRQNRAQSLISERFSADVTPDVSQRYSRVKQRCSVLRLGVRVLGRWAPGAIFNGGQAVSPCRLLLYWFQRRPHPQISSSGVLSCTKKGSTFFFWCGKQRTTDYFQRQIDGRLKTRHLIFWIEIFLRSK